MSKTWDNELWLLIGVISLVLFVCTVCGCDDSTPPEMEYLGPPIVDEIVAVPGDPRRLDAWSLNESGYPFHAAFGWTIKHEWLSSGSIFEQPGIHVKMNVGSSGEPWGGPVLEKFVTGSGDGPDYEGDPKEITLVGGDDGVVRAYLGARNWPNNTSFENRVAARWHVCGFDEYDFISTCKFRQEGAWFFSRPCGGLEMSMTSNTSPTGVLSVLLGPEPEEMPYDMSPASPLPRPLVAQIPPTSAECALDVNYPPYIDPNETGEGILVNTQWFQARVTDGEWGLSPALFITPLPFGTDNVDSIAQAAWPYTICYHAPAESAGIGALNATVSITDPNISVDITIHEVGPCPNCNGQLWRSDYLLPLATTIPVLERSGNVVVFGLPCGYPTIKIDPVIGAREIWLLSTKWLARDSVLDINGDGIVNFKDLTAFRR